MLDKDQIDWLINALVSSKAPFKLIAIGGQVLSSEAAHENYAIFPEERQYLLNKIREAKIEGVIFLDGYRHHTALSKMQENKYVYPLYDLTRSPLTSGYKNDREQNNKFNLKEKIFRNHNFGLLNISGSRTDRDLKITIYDKDGKEVWTKGIRAK